jgi:hypothetical protein
MTPALRTSERIDFGRLERRLKTLFPNSQVAIIPVGTQVLVRGQAYDGEEAQNILQIVRAEVIPDAGAKQLSTTTATGTRSLRTADLVETSAEVWAVAERPEHRFPRYRDQRTLGPRRIQRDDASHRRGNQSVTDAKLWSGLGSWLQQRFTASERGWKPRSRRRSYSERYL